MEKQYIEMLFAKNFVKEDISTEDILIFTNEDIRTCVFVVGVVNNEVIEDCIKLQKQLNHQFADKWSVLFYEKNETWNDITDDLYYFMKRPIHDIEYLWAAKKNLKIEVRLMRSAHDVGYNNYILDPYTELNGNATWELYKFIWNVESNSTINVPAIAGDIYDFVRYVVCKNTSDKNN